MARPKSEVPWLDQHDNGTWYVHWYDPGQKRTARLSLRTKDVGEAKNRFGVFLTEGGDIVRRAPGVRLKVIDAVDQYIREHANIRCADPVRQRGIAVHLKAFFGETDLSEIDIPLSRAYANWRDASPATVKRELGMLVAAANHAIKWDRLPAGQIPRIEYPAVQSSEVTAFTLEEIQLLIREAEPKLRSFIILAYFTAARRNSIETLELRQIDIPHRRIYLHKAGDVRTNKRRATVPINDACLREIRVLSAMTNTPWLFGRPQAMYRPFRKLCERLGLQGRHPHLLRHSRATHLLQAGRSVFQVAGLLGDTVTTVQNTYGHHTPEHSAAAVTDFDAQITAPWAAE